MNPFSQEHDSLRKSASSYLYVTIILLLFSCSYGKPPESVIHDNITKMVMVDRAMEFVEEVTRIEVISMKKYRNQVEVEVRVEGWATHRDLVLGAVLPISKERRPGWSRWKFFCHKVDKKWVIAKKYKVEEGFEEN